MTCRALCLNVLLFAVITGCSSSNQNTAAHSRQPAQQAVAESNVVKVYVEQNGAIVADGKEVALRDLDLAFRKLKENSGMVYYSRANVKGEPPSESMQVVELIVKYGLPVKFFTDKTFTVAVKPK